MATTGCFAYRPTPLAPAPGAKVRIVLKSPMTIATAADTALRSRRSYERVCEATGTVTAVAGDTIALRLGELRTPAGSIPGVTRQVALLPTASITSIQERRFEAGQTFLAGLGLSVWR